MEKKFNINAKWIAFVAVFSAMCAVLYLIQIPLPIFPTFLKIHISDLPALIAGFSMGPFAGLIVTTAKFLLEFIDGTDTAGVGELANFLNGLAFVLPSALFYKKNKTLKNAIFALFLGAVCSTAVACIINRLFLIKAYTYFYAKGNFDAIVGMCKVLYPNINQDNFYTYYIFCACLPFNFLRVTIVGVITFLVYKPISKTLSKIYFYNNSSQEEGLISRSESQTLQIAREYAKTLKSGDIVLLKGDLGAGKTTFTKGIAQELGIEESITSPTYAYMNEYQDKLYHFDCYRLSCGEDAEALGLTEYFYAGGICVIEWSENITSVLPENCKEVTITNIGKTNRRIKL